MYTDFFREVSWVASDDASSSIPEFNSSVKIFSQLPVFTVLPELLHSSFFLVNIKSFIFSTHFLVSLFFQRFLQIHPAHHHYFVSYHFGGLKVLSSPVFILLSCDCFKLLLIMVILLSSHGLTFIIEINNFFLIFVLTSCSLTFHHGSSGAQLRLLQRSFGAKNCPCPSYT